MNRRTLLARGLAALGVGVVSVLPSLPVRAGGGSSGVAIIPKGQRSVVVHPSVPITADSIVIATPRGALVDYAEAVSVQLHPSHGEFTIWITSPGNEYQVMWAVLTTQ